MSHPEIHRTHRVGWLRAAVLGANDGIVSTGSLIAGVAAGGYVVLLVPRPALVGTVSGGSLVFLTLLGALAARAGGAPTGVSIARVTFWGALAMALTAAVGAWFVSTF